LSTIYSAYKSFSESRLDISNLDLVLIIPVPSQLQIDLLSKYLIDIMKKLQIIGAIIILGLGQIQVFSQSYLLEIGYEDSLYSEILQEKRNIWIKYPKYYNQDSNKEYPVVYILDGETQLRALDAVCDYYEGHFLPDMILVGISNAENRMRDLTTSEMKMRYGWPVNEETGGAETFAGFLEHELIPYIDSILPATGYRTLIGHSFGGLFTINTLLNHGHLFSNYIAIDPSLDWDNQKLLNHSRAKLFNTDFNEKALFVSLSAASLHMQDESVNMANLMTDTSEYTLFARSIVEFSKFAETQEQNGLRFSWKHYPNDIHGTVTLPTIRDGLISIFEWYQLESFWKFNDFETPTNELLELVQYREEKLEDNFGYPVPPFEEELFNMMGYMSLESGQPDKSKAFFEMGIQYFPESANAYDSMADFYISQNDNENALLNLRKAYGLSGSKLYLNKIKKIENGGLK
jgi:predicted alpha/beta superfamily hydrolase